MAGSGDTWRIEGAVDLHIDATAERIYALIADVVSTGERSEECRRVEWARGSPQVPVVGARFRGHNRRGLARWTRTCEIVTADLGHAFAFRTVPERFDPSRKDSCLWSYRLEPEGSGTRVTHAYRFLRLPLPPFKWLYSRALPNHKDMRPAMRHTLDALKRAAEGRPA